MGVQSTPARIHGILGGALCVLLLAVSFSAASPNPQLKGLTTQQDEPAFRHADKKGTGGVAGSTSKVGVAGSGATIASLGEGDAVFWQAEANAFATDMPFTGRGRNNTCGVLPTGLACLEYYVVLLEDGGRLRMGAHGRITSPSAYEIAVYGPGCTRSDLQCREYLSSFHTGGMTRGVSQEAFVPTPARGMYQLVAYVQKMPGTEPLEFRAKLESEPKSRPEHPSHPWGKDKDAKPVLPDLRPDPPFELNFNPFLVARHLPGSRPGSACSEAEYLEAKPERCFRFSFGWQNVGEGPWEMVFRGDSTDPDDIVEGQANQRITRTDGSTYERPAGTYKLHAQHRHYHYENLFEVKLLPVLNATDGILGEPVAIAAKLGVCGHDWKMAEFDRFYQAPAGSHDAGTDCIHYNVGISATTAESRIGLSAGWGDFYGEGTPGNYIDVKDAPPGLYVLRMKVDVDDLLLEANETNNFGYTYFEMRPFAGDGDSPIEYTDDYAFRPVLERGLGLSPWDINRTVLTLPP